MGYITDSVTPSLLFSCTFRVSKIQHFHHFNLVRSQTTLRTQITARTWPGRRGASVRCHVVEETRYVDKYRPIRHPNMDSDVICYRWWSGVTVITAAVSLRQLVFVTVSLVYSNHVNRGRGDVWSCELWSVLRHFKPLRCGKSLCGPV